MKWQILIATEPHRKEFLEQLLSLLEPQISALGPNRFDLVDILIHEESGQNIGEIREKIRRKATGDYVSFVDSDDLVAPNYISSIVPQLDGVDYIGFEIAMYLNHERIKPAYHSLNTREWTEDENGYYRDIGHVNPMRRELALQRPMTGGIGEDARWACEIRGLVKTQHYIREPLYFYLWRQPKDDARDARDPRRLALLSSLRAGV